MMIHKVLVLTAALTLSACVLQSGLGRSFAPEKVEVTTNSADKSVTYLAPNAGKEPDVVRLRATLDAKGLMAYDIYVESVYRYPWRYYYAALDANGSSLPFGVLSVDIGTCVTSMGSCVGKETVSMSVSREFLLARQESGISFKLYGKNGNQDFAISGPYVKSFLQGVPARAPGGK